MTREDVRSDAPSAPLHPSPIPPPRTSQFRICIPSPTSFAGRCCHGFRTSSLPETRDLSYACLSPQGKSELKLRNAMGICASLENKGPNQRSQCRQSKTPQAQEIKSNKQPSQGCSNQKMTWYPFANWIRQRYVINPAHLEPALHYFLDDYQVLANNRTQLTRNGHVPKVMSALSQMQLWSQKGTS